MWNVDNFKKSKMEWFSGVVKFIGENRDMIFLVVLALFLGVEVISNVPTILHTPLMSGANAIHGVVVVGGIIILLTAADDFTRVIGTLATFLGTLNVVGGFAVTHRMLKMFKKKG